MNYPWHSKLPLVGCFTAEGRALRNLYKGEKALRSNRLYDARCFFQAATQIARSNGFKWLEMVALHGQATAMEAQSLPELAVKELDSAVALSDGLDQEDPAVEAVRCKRERVVEQLMLRHVVSRLRIGRLAMALVDHLNQHGYDLNEQPAVSNLHDELVMQVSARLGYRHWLTAMILHEAACNSDDYSQRLELNSRAYQIALEFPEKAAPLLQSIKEGLAEFPGSSSSD